MKKILILVILTGLLCNCQFQDKSYWQDGMIQEKDVLISLIDFQKSAGTIYDMPKSGYQFLIITIKIENCSDHAVMYDAYHWQGENKNGQKFFIVFPFFNMKTSLNSQKIKAGGIIKGTIVFEIPIKMKEFYFCYDNGFIFKMKHSFKIQIKAT